MFYEKHSLESTQTQRKKCKKLLTASGVSLSDCSFSNEPIVFFAIGNFSPVLLKFLVDNGALLSGKNKEGQSPLQFAQELVKRAMEHKSENVRLYRLAKANVDYLEEFMK